MKQTIIRKLKEQFGESFHDFVVYYHGLAFVAIILVLIWGIITIVKTV